MLDRSKLQNLKPYRDGAYIAACPMCRSLGMDNSGNHLILYNSGKFGCIANQGDRTHNKGIYKLVGTHSNFEEFEEEIEEKTKVDKIFDPELLNKLVRDHSYWEKRGIPSSIVEKFGGGVALDGMMKQRYVIPIFDNNKNLVGFTGRRLDEKMSLKYKHLGAVSRWVWGDLENIKRDKFVIIIEGPVDLFALNKYNITHALVLFGVRVGQGIFGFLIANDIKNILISTNRDEKHTVGQRAAENIKKSLSKFFPEDNIKIALPPEGFKDFADCDEISINKWKSEFYNLWKLKN